MAYGQSTHDPLIFCRGCGIYFSAKRWNRKRCEVCRKTRRRDQTRQHVSAYRQRNGHLPPSNETRVPSKIERKERAKTEREIRTENGRKVLLLVCQHEMLVPATVPMPMEGEFLYCTKCADWKEFTAGKKRPLCPAKLHRMTPWNEILDPATHLKTCRRCYTGGPAL